MSGTVYRAAHHAMATSWEILIYHSSKRNCEAAANEAFARIDTLENELSRFRPDSDIARIAHAKKGQAVPVGSAMSQCLELAMAVHSETGGAFDITMADVYEDQAARPLTEEWPFSLDTELETVTVHRDGVKLDLGGLGKGFAIDELVPLFEDWDIEHALFNAGKSTLYGMGHPPDEAAWPVNAGPDPTNCYPLTGQALSGSGFGVQGVHIYDPRTGRPLATERTNAWVFAESAALADALSTAVLVMSDEEIGAFHEKHPEVSIMMI